MIKEAKAQRKNIRRDNLRVLCKAANIATIRDIKVSKFIPFQFVEHGPSWVQYQVFTNKKGRAEVAINQYGEAEIVIFCDKGYISDSTYICTDADKRVKARLDLLKKQLKCCEER